MILILWLRVIVIVVIVGRLKDAIGAIYAVVLTVAVLMIILR